MVREVRPDRGTPPPMFTATRLFQRVMHDMPGIMARVLEFNEQIVEAKRANEAEGCSDKFTQHSEGD